MSEQLNRYAIPLVIVIAIFQFFLLGYDFGLDGHIEKLAQIYRAMDDGYLVNDSFVNASDSWSPRTYFSATVAALGRLISVEYAFLAIELTSVIIISLFTFLFATRILRLPPLGGICAAVISVQPVALVAGCAQLYSHNFIPASCGAAAAVAALYMAFSSRPLLAAACSAVAMFFHPQVGLFTVASIAVVLVVGKMAGEIKTSWLRIALFLAITTVLFLALWHPYLTETSDFRLSDSDFLDIYARFRVPHHVLPSIFKMDIYMKWAAFWAVAVFAAVILKKDWKIRIPAFSMSAMTALILLACVFGYVTIELMGNRLGATLQPFRMTMLPNWFAIMLVGGLAGVLLERAERLPEAMAAAMMIFGARGKWLAVIGFCVFLVVRRLRKRTETPVSNAVSLACLLIAIYSIFRFSGGQLAWFNILAGLALVLIPLTMRSPKFVYGSLAIALAVILTLAAVNPYYKIPYINKMLPQSFKVADNPVYSHPIYKFARESTDPDAVFIAPYEFRHMRIMGRRALGACFRGVPFHDRGIKEWYERILAVYGRAPWGNGHYFQLKDDALAEISRKYGVDYAIMHAQKISSYKTVFRYKRYKILDLHSRN